MGRPINMNRSITCVIYYKVCMESQSMVVFDRPQSHVFNTTLTRQNPLLDMLPFTQITDEAGIITLATHSTPAKKLHATRITPLV